MINEERLEELPTRLQAAARSTVSSLDATRLAMNNMEADQAEEEDDTVED